MSVDDVRAYQDWCSLVVTSLGALMAQTARFGSEESAPQHGETTAAYLRRIAGDEPLETYEEGLRRPIPLREPRTYAQYLIDRGILEGWIIEYRMADEHDFGDTEMCRRCGAYTRVYPCRA